MTRYQIDNGEQLLCDLIRYRATAIPTQIIELYDDVDATALTYAVGKALYDHPYFSTRLVKEGVMYYLEENSARPVIEERPLSEAFNYGHKADNYFPWKITYSGKNICFNCSHEPTDGGGLFTFISSVMEYYSRYKKGDMSDIPEKTTREERIADETFLPSTLSDQNSERPIGHICDFKPNPFDSSHLSETLSCERFTIDKSKLRNTAFSFDASPFAVIGPVLSRACLPYLAGDDKIVKLMIPCPNRALFNTHNLHNFTSANNFYYFDKMMKDMPFEQIATLFRARLDLLSDSSLVMDGFENFRKLGAALDTAEGRLKIARSLIGGIYDMNIVYTHITRIGISEKAGEYIRRVYAVLYKQNPFITCMGINFKNDVTLTISSKFSDGGFYDNICSELDELKIPYTREKVSMGAMRFYDFDES